MFLTLDEIRRLIHETITEETYGWWVLPNGTIEEVHHDAQATR